MKEIRMTHRTQIAIGDILQEETGAKEVKADRALEAQVSVPRSAFKEFCGKRTAEGAGDLRTDAVAAGANRRSDGRGEPRRVGAEVVAEGGDGDARDMPGCPSPS